MVESRSYTKLRGDLLVVVTLGLVRMPRTELLHGKGHSVTATLHQSNGASSARTEDFSEFTVLALETMVIRKWNTGYSASHRWCHNARFAGPSRLFALDDRRGILVLLLVLILILVLVANLEESLQIRHRVVAMLVRLGIRLGVRAVAAARSPAAAKDACSTAAAFCIRGCALGPG